MTELNKKQLSELKTQLIKTCNELETELGVAASGNVPEPLDRSEVGRLSRIDAIQQRAIADAASSAHKQQLVLVHRALQKLQDGEYGECEACGEPIPFQRLQIQPETRYCVNCLQALEEKYG